MTKFKKFSIPNNKKFVIPKNRGIRQSALVRKAMIGFALGAQIVAAGVLLLSTGGTAIADTLQDQACLVEANGEEPNCTSNSVSSATATGVVVDADCGAGGTGFITLNLSADIDVTANGRYDVGFYYPQTGTDGFMGDTCSVATFDPGTYPTTIDDGDSCGDFNQSVLTDYNFGEIKISCDAVDNFGDATITSCAAWNQSGGDPVCSLDTVPPVLPLPGTKAMCNCAETTISLGAITVTKEVFDSEGNPVIGAGPFTVTVGDESIALLSGPGNAQSVVVAPGDYAVSEETPADTIYSFQNISCDGGPAVPIETVSITGSDKSECVVTNACEKGDAPATACYETATFDEASCSWSVTGEQPEEPTLAGCWETATFNDVSCAWDVSGTQDPECYETATFNDASCAWDVSGTQDPEPATACYETATFNDTSCAWDVSGTQDPEPATACYETATFNDASCAWDVSGTQDPEPATACYETATFNNTSCAWDVSGTQDPEPTTACYETATFDDASCAWSVSGTQDPEPATACYESASFNEGSCAWDVTGVQPPQPMDTCEAYTFDTTACSWIEPQCGSFPTRTIGYWKTHPDALSQNLDIELCGTTYTEVCDVVDLLNTRGGGANNFTRQAAAALLNCGEWGCPTEVRDAIALGCAGDASQGNLLDDYNNGLIWDSAHEAELPAGHGPADKKFCR